MPSTESHAGFGYQLRPVAESDAEFILSLRLDPAKARFLGPTNPSVQSQQEWIRDQRERSGDTYWLIERLGTDTPEGCIGLYDIASESAEWGRWVLRNGSMAGPASVLLQLGYAFDGLGLRTVRCRTIADNSRVLGFHDRLPYSTRDREDRPGHEVPFVVHTLAAADWPAFAAALEPSARRVAERLDRT